MKADGSLGGDGGIAAGSHQLVHLNQDLGEKETRRKSVSGFDRAPAVVLKVE